MARFHHILSIETSCDDTSVAVVRSGGFVLACCSAHQDLAHAPFGGVVPEIASRQHTEALLPLIEVALNRSGLLWSQIDGLAVTNRPGLLGSLLVGLVTAKTLALTKNLPWIAVNHIEGHILAPLLSDASHRPPPGFDFPYVALVISGGHSHLFQVESLGQYQLLGHTLDDAAGEAFDKFAKMVGLGYPGGVLVDQEARLGDPSRFSFPRSMIHDSNLNLSFSGLKAAAQRLLLTLSEDEIGHARRDLCASFQEAIVDVLLNKLERAADQQGQNRLVLTGGVSANSRLRARAEELALRRSWQLAIAPPRYCTDNAAMIGLAGLLRLERGESSAQDVGPSPNSHAMDFK